jgi:homoserine O-acetyltransferase
MTMKITSQFGAYRKEAEIGWIETVAIHQPLKLDSGALLDNFPMAYQTYGTLNKAKTNAVLICHGLTGDQYLAGLHPVTERAGWWDDCVGPGKMLDTDRFFLICINVMGGCMGSVGPKEVNLHTGRFYGIDFPVITIRDMVRGQKLLLERLDIPSLCSVIGASMGGMLALEWSVTYPDYVRSVILIATAARHSAQNIAFHEIGRQSIMADPSWLDGHYWECGTYPEKGVAVARMTAHVTYLSEQALQRKFGRQLQDKMDVTYGFEPDFQVESYLRHQGVNFVDRFDANSYLYITRAMDYFDLPSRYNQRLAQAFHGNKARFAVFCFSSDWLFSPNESKQIVHALNASCCHVSYLEIDSDKGHDAFLLDEPVFRRSLYGFMQSISL